LNSSVSPSLRLIFDVSCLTSEHITGIGVTAKATYRALRERDDLELIPVIPVQRQSRGAVVRAHIGDNPRLFWPLLSELRWRAQKQAAPVVFHGPDFRLLTKMPFTRSVVTVHDTVVFHEGFNSDQFRKRGQRRMLSTLRQQNVRAVITPSEAVRQELVDDLSFPPERIITIPHGADHLPLETGPRPIPQAYFLCVGTVEKRKNLIAAIEAFEEWCLARANQQRPLDHLLVIVGKDGFGADQIRERAQASPYAHLIRWMGTMDAKSLNAFYTSATSFIFLSHYEGFGLTPLEAMRNGCPVITLARGAMGEVTAGSEAIRLKNEDAKSVALALNQVLNWSNEERAQNRARNLAHSHLFTWRRTTDSLVNLYRSVQREP
jgi:glycosyltransferase involved in cell wall biosynthesis